MEPKNKKKPGAKKLGAKKPAAAKRPGAKKPAAAKKPAKGKKSPPKQPPGKGAADKALNLAARNTVARSIRFADLSSVVGEQLYPGAYQLLDTTDKEIGVVWVEQVSSTIYREYFGVPGLVGGPGTIDKTMVFKLVWRNPFLANFPAFKAYCLGKGYNFHILSTCVSQGW